MNRSLATYSTPRPNATNWLGLYTDPCNGPVNEKYVGPSLKWSLRHGRQRNGDPADRRTGTGTYIVFALAQDGYQWLATPVKLRITSNAPLHFITDTFDLRNARAAAPYQATIRGLVRGNTDGLTFRKTGGAQWIDVSANGDITGTRAHRRQVVCGSRRVTQAAKPARRPWASRCGPPEHAWCRSSRR
ncbi:hypothetical protein [Kibdelosporangium philippinense]|uniref:hypothetical protein n=1 Tax=Kibdelosporangium philippinense TaxID=211113 RepID=UPI00361F8550